MIIPMRTLYIFYEEVFLMTNTQRHGAKAKRYPSRPRSGAAARAIGTLAVAGLVFAAALACADYGQKLTMAYPKHDEVIARDEDWALRLVNPWNSIPDNYEVNLREVPGGEQVDERIYEPLMEMLEAARESNCGELPNVESGYRTQETQQRLYDQEIAKNLDEGYSMEEARELAGQWVAVPGTSEHQLGLAVDLSGETYDVFLWLQENSYKYGFIWRYQGDKTPLTGIAEEVWHYRYVGAEAAAEMYQQGLCLEEYLEN